MGLFGKLLGLRPRKHILSEQEKRLVYESSVRYAISILLLGSFTFIDYMFKDECISLSLV